MFTFGALGGLLMTAIMWFLGYQIAPVHQYSSSWIDLNGVFKFFGRVAVAGSIVVVAVITAIAAFGKYFANSNDALMFQLGILTTYNIGVAAYFIFRYGFKKRK